MTGTLKSLEPSLQRGLTCDLAPNDQQVAEGVEFAVDRLGDDISPRLHGPSTAHVRQLVDLPDLPPVVVHWSSLRIIDGVHRVHAAKLRGDQYVKVNFFHGTDAEAFVLAVQLNSSHGLPLSAQDRAAAATRIIESHSEWSDRRIASVCGVAPRTVAAIRSSSTADSQQLNRRVGRDGRIRPLSAEQGRQRAAMLMRDRPGASLRELAREAGISLGTAADVRRTLAHALADTAECGDLTGTPAPPPDTEPRDDDVGKQSLRARSEPDPLQPILSKLSRLMRDPSLRYNAQGRSLLRLMSATLAFTAQADAVADYLPGHRREAVRDVARACADGWQLIAETISDS